MEGITPHIPYGCAPGFWIEPIKNVIDGEKRNLKEAKEYVAVNKDSNDPKVMANVIALQDRIRDRFYEKSIARLTRKLKRYERELQPTTN